MTAFAFRPSLLRLAVLHLRLVCMFRRVKDVHWPLTADGTLDDDWQIPPDSLWHWDQDAGVVQVLLVCRPIVALLVTLLSARTFLERKTRKEEKEACQQDPANATGI